MDKEVEGMDDQEFEKLYKVVLNYYADVRINGGLWAIPKEVRRAEQEMYRRGIDPISLEGDDERLKIRIEEIKQEKAQKRENDPEGYKAAQRRYTELLQAQLDKGYVEELGEEDNTRDSSETENDMDESAAIEKLDDAASSLYEYELRRRHWRDDIAKLRKNISDRVAAIKDGLSNEEKRALNIKEEIDRLTQSARWDKEMAFDAAWHPGDQDGFMSEMFNGQAQKTEQLIADLKDESNGLPQVDMQNILRRAIADVKLTMEDFHDAKAHQPDSQLQTNENGVDK